MTGKLILYTAFCHKADLNKKMINAREEFEVALRVPGEDLEVLCAWVAFRTWVADLGDNYLFEDAVKICLKPGHTPAEYEEFLSKIDQNYNNGFGAQELFGKIWLTNGEWIKRREDKASENWERVVRPHIPEECKGHPVAKNANKR